MGILSARDSASNVPYSANITQPAPAREVREKLTRSVSRCVCSDRLVRCVCPQSESRGLRPQACLQRWASLTTAEAHARTHAF